MFIALNYPHFSWFESAKSVYLLFLNKLPNPDLWCYQIIFLVQKYFKSNLLTCDGSLKHLIKCNYVVDKDFSATVSQVANTISIADACLDPVQDSRTLQIDWEPCSAWIPSFLPFLCGGVSVMERK